MSADFGDIPLYVKITLPAVVVLLAIIITCIVLRRHPGIFRKCRKNNKPVLNDMEMRTLPSHGDQPNSQTPCVHRLLPPSPSDRYGESKTPFLLTYPPRESDFERIRQVNVPEQGPNHSYGQFPPSCVIPGCEYGMENHLYARHNVPNDVHRRHDVPHSPSKSRRQAGRRCEPVEHSSKEECSPGSQPHQAKPPGNAPDVRVVDVISQPFIPGSKGYITMSSPHIPPVGNCRPRDGYITARPEHRTRKPVNVCQPMTRSDEHLSDIKDDINERPITNSKYHAEEKRQRPGEPVYEKLDRYYRPKRDAKTTSLPSSKIQRKTSAPWVHRSHYDSLPLLPVEMSFVEIPIGPFISMDKREERMSETIARIQGSESFENMFEGAWWHSESEHDIAGIGDDAPDLPSKHLRDKTSTLPRANRQSGQRPTSAPYVTMNKGWRPGVGVRCSGSFTLACPGQHPSSRSVDSYMSHGQMMKMLQFYDVEDISGQISDVLPPPVPCKMHHEYVNAKATRSKETI